MSSIEATADCDSVKNVAALPQRETVMVRMVIKSRRLFALVLLVAALGLLACTTSNVAGSASNVHRPQAAPKTVASVPSATPLPPASDLPLLTFIPKIGGAVPMNVEIADTEALRECGLMNRTRMPDNQGMVFVFTEQVSVPFWMKDTLIDLSVAFVDASGTVVDVQEMKSQSLDSHFPAKPYQYAIEANATWYARHGIAAGDTVDLGQILDRTGSTDSCHLTPDSSP